MRKFVCAAIVAVCAVSIAMAEDFRAVITKIEDGKVTFKKAPKEKGGEFGEETTLKLSKDAKLVKGKFSKGDDGKPKIEAGDALEKDAVMTMLEKAKKGVFAHIITDGGGKNITEIRFVQFKKKKKKDNN